jgi:hypothetical protein
MRRRDQSGRDQGIERCSGQTVDQALDAEATKPILLALTGYVAPPLVPGELGCEALGYGRH